MSQKVLVELSLDFFPSLESWNVEEEIEMHNEDYAYIINEINSGKKFNKEIIEKYKQSMKESNLNKFREEVEKGPSKKHVTNHYKNHYKNMILSILKNSQIDEYYDDSHEPTLEKNNIIKFQMDFPETFTDDEIDDILTEGLEITEMNISDTLLKWEKELFILQSEFAPIFELGYFNINLNKVKFLFM